MGRRYALYTLYPSMHTTFLIWTLAVLLAGIGCLIIAFTEESVTAFVAGAISTAAGLIMLAMSLVNPFGNPDLISTDQFRIERTPYRVVVTAFDRERTYTDAYTVQNAGQIERVILTTRRNAWGVMLESPPHGPQIDVVFAKEAGK